MTIRHAQAVLIVARQLALRGDFPLVPHLNPRVVELPRSLCLYAEPWRDLKRQWSPYDFIERVREWLALTAVGELHLPDQPLEPLLFESPHVLVLPEQLIAAPGREPGDVLRLRQVDGGLGRKVFLGERQAEIFGRDAGPRWLAMVIRAAPQQHGVIRRTPRTLGDLHELLLPAGVDLLAVLRTRCAAWMQQPDVSGLSLMLIIMLPKARHDGGAVEAIDCRAFLLTETVGELQQALGQYGTAKPPPSPGSAPVARAAKGIVLSYLNPVFELTRDRAATLNGYPAAADVRVAAVGAGALGSQMCMNLLRAGWGRWEVIDDDYLLPHNLARHALDGLFVGYPKAQAMSITALAMFPQDGLVVSHVAADLLEPGTQAAAVARALGSAQVILDLSASVTVARYLALDAAAAGRRVSLFLNPAGTDLVCLAEDRERSLQLDLLEMQYYRHVLNTPELADHLRVAGQPIRYGQTCRDMSATLQQDRIAALAAAGSRAVRHVVEGSAARIAIWRTDDELSISRIEISAAPVRQWSAAGWRVRTDRWLLDRVAELRRIRLPRETGGVLVGAFDMERKIIYVVDVLPSPADSIEQTISYIRGSDGLQAHVDEIDLVSGGMLGYVGEWHSHPSGYDATPSADDRRLFTWIGEHTRYRGRPPVMLIAADGAYRWFVNTMPQAS
jgi:integrative and conjugative element protein (TIGR02256 family)